MENTFESFAETYNLKLKAKKIDNRPDSLMDEENWQHYKCRLVSPIFGKSKKFYFSHGPAANLATVAEMLHTLESDCVTDNYRDVADFMADFGYDPDAKMLRTGMEVYKACLKNETMLREYLGPAFEILQTCEYD